MKVNVLAWAVGLIALGGLTACDDDPTEPTTGSIEVTIETSGDGTDPDGYDVTVAGDTEAVDVDDTVTFEGVSTGSRSVTLSDIADNCEVDGDNPVQVTVEEDEEATVTFEVTCDEAEA